MRAAAEKTGTVAATARSLYGRVGCENVLYVLLNMYHAHILTPYLMRTTAATITPAAHNCMYAVAYLTATVAAN